ncbi:ZIP family metal transporter [Candidatus Micrarchaeota archaeon]|nr:ZIP family metal transporter [Candidatus Micrarchaeota archaeon]
MEFVLMYIVAAVLIVSLVSLIGIVTIFFRKKSIEQSLLALVGFATGAMLGAAFLELIPESIEACDVGNAFVFVLAGLISFLVLEKLLFWRHCHEGKCDVHAFTYLNLVGDGLHNFFDGMIIAASFMASVPAGVATTIAVIAHEIPQELGDFAVLIYGGFSKRKALAYNFLSAITAVAGALIVYFAGISADVLKSVLLPFAAGGFIYIASADLIPELHKEKNLKKSAVQIVLLVAGVLTVWAAHVLLEH